MVIAPFNFAVAAGEKETSVDIKAFDGKSPRFELETFFAGKLEGWGYTVSRFNTLQTQTKILAKGKWHPATSTLAFRETYTFDDGHSDVL